MVPLPVHSLSRVRSSAMALADEALAHAVILVSLVTALRETNSG